MLIYRTVPLSVPKLFLYTDNTDPNLPSHSHSLSPETLAMAFSHSSDYEFKVKMLLNSASSGCFYLLEKMARDLDKGKGIAETLKEIKDSDGRGAFHLAAAQGMTHICQYFVEDLNYSVDFRSEKSETPLFHSAMGGHLDTARYLISHGAALVAADIDGLTPLHCAAQHGKHDIVELLLSLAVPVDLEINSVNGTALALAAMQGQAKTVEILLDHNANVNKAVNTMFTPLICAIYSGSLKCTKLLIEAGADLNNKYPLEMAICCESPEILKCLLKAGADPNVRNENGLLPIEIAAMEGKSESMELLYPLTSPVLEAQNWSVSGILHHVKSDAFKKRAGTASRSAQLKVKGDDAVKKNDYRAAVGIYSLAIKIDSTNATLYSNRSLCWHRLGLGHCALRDAQMALSLRPNWPKAYYRVGAAFMLLKDYDQASKAYLDGLAFGDNEEIENACWYAMDCKDRSQRGLEIQSYSNFSEPVDPSSFIHLPSSCSCCLLGDHEDVDIIEVGYAIRGEDGEMHETVISSG